MNYLNRPSNYDKFPTTIINNYDDCFNGYEEIINKINSLNTNVKH